MVLVDFVNGGELYGGLFMGETEYLVIRSADGRYFRDWERLKDGPRFYFCRPLVGARPFEKEHEQLAKSFQRFLSDNGIASEIFVVKSNRLLKQIGREVFPPREPRMIRR